MSWYPLGGKDMTGDLLDNQIVVDLAKKYSKSSAQIVLKWHIEMGFIVIPGSKNIEHIKDNLNIFDFNLTSDDMKLLNRLNNGKRRYTRTDDALNRYATWKPEFEK